MSNSHLWHISIFPAVKYVNFNFSFRFCWLYQFVLLLFFFFFWRLFGWFHTDFSIIMPSFTNLDTFSVQFVCSVKKKEKKRKIIFFQKRNKQVFILNLRNIFYSKELFYVKKSEKRLFKRICTIWKVSKLKMLFSNKIQLLEEIQFRKENTKFSMEIKCGWTEGNHHFSFVGKLKFHFMNWNLKSFWFLSFLTEWHLMLITIFLVFFLQTIENFHFVS